MKQIQMGAILKSFFNEFRLSEWLAAWLRSLTIFVLKVVPLVVH